jgi:hypothetical protein
MQINIYSEVTEIFLKTSIKNREGVVDSSCLTTSDIWSLSRITH